MKTDLCLNCKAPRGEHRDLGADLARALDAQARAARAAPVALNVSACAAFVLDRKATWAAERGQHRPRMVTLLTGCTVCGARSVSYHRDEHEQLRHTACPGPREAAR